MTGFSRAGNDYKASLLMNKTGRLTDQIIGEIVGLSQSVVTRILHGKKWATQEIREEIFRLVRRFGPRTPRKYDKESEEFLRQNYRKLGVKECAKQLRRTPRAIICKAYKMGLSGPFRGYKLRKDCPDYPQVKQANIEALRARREKRKMQSEDPGRELAIRQARSALRGSYVPPESICRFIQKGAS